MTGDAPEQLDQLLRAEAGRRLPPFLFFWGHTPKGDRPGPSVLSQWWPVTFEVELVRYHHAEGFLMAEKARLFGDDEALAAILAAADPAEAKALGRRVRGFDEPTWEAERYAIAVRGNLAKFGQHDDLRWYLVGTAPSVLVEASPVDPVWGMGLAAADERARRPSRWQGRNLLGFALTEVRGRLSRP